jgi:DNA adenine methylase
MKYMGSKARFAKDLLPIILKDRTEEQYYVEPFVGGCNIIDKVKGKRIASDSNKYLIALWKGLQQGRELIMEIPKELYDKARNQYNERENHNFDDFTIGWIGFMGSFNGRFYGGGYSGKHKNRDYIAEQIRNTLKQLEAIKDIDFYNCNYDQLQIPKGSIVYCDIPYQGTKEYDTKDKFNHDKFWQWCRDISKDNTVFVSEYNAPNDFECVWQKEVNVSIRPNKTLAQVEKLFKFSKTNVQ